MLRRDMLTRLRAAFQSCTNLTRATSLPIASNKHYYGGSALITANGSHKLLEAQQQRWWPRSAVTGAHRVVGWDADPSPVEQLAITERRNFVGNDVAEDARPSLEHVKGFLYSAYVWRSLEVQ